MIDTFHQSYTVSNTELSAARARIQDHVYRQLIEALSSHIAHVKMETQASDYTTEFRIRLIVATPEEFQKLVNNEVERTVRTLRGAI